MAFLFEALAKQLELTVPDDEVQQQISEIVQNLGPDRQSQLTAFYAREENRRVLCNRLLHDKALRWVVEKANVKVVEQDVAGGEEKA
jgi:FKBP-type peptidyl-prolyl cis-trans isomerase (trigger factor)